MSPSEAPPVLAPETLEDLGRRLLRAAGASEAVAAAVAGHLVEAEARGVASHGLRQLPGYVEQLRAGEVDGAAEPAVEKTEASVVRVDGGGGFGIPAMEAALAAALARLRAAPLAAAAVVGCGHTGRLGRYVERAAEAGCLAVALGGGAGSRWPDVAPYGGARGAYGTNPYAVALPGGADGPVVVDFATSAVPQGRVALARTRGERLPPGVLIDRDGRPTTDPRDLEDGGALLPAAGPKGGGLALVAELVGRALLGPAHEYNWLLILLRLDALRAPEDYAAAAEQVLAAVRAVPPAEGFEAVAIPGELERARAARARRAGIALPAAVWAEIAEAARALGVEPPG